MKNTSLLASQFVLNYQWRMLKSLRTEIAGMLKSAKPPKSNISKQERVALNALKKDKEMMVMCADKGKCIVVQNKKEYESKVKEMLNDHKTYEKLTKDPTPGYKRKLVEILKRLKTENKINESQYRLLYPTAENTPRIFRGQIYRQIFGAILANLFMEWLEREAIATSPLDCKPKLWRRYVDDVLEIIKKDSTQKLTDHLNSIDPTGNIKFTFEEENQGKIPFLDTLIVRKEDGSLKLLVYRKKTHTDQYLNFQSQHQLHQKLGVIRTLMDRMENIVTEEADKKEEEVKFRNALRKCGYPKWSLDRVKQQIKNKQPTQRKKNKESETPSKGMVVLPYVEGVAEQAQRIFKKYGISTAMRPTNTLKSILVHPKDKKDITQTSDIVYDIPCKSCKKSYIGETGRQFGVRLKEHQKDTETVTPIVNTLGQQERNQHPKSTNPPSQTMQRKKTISSIGMGQTFLTETLTHSSVGSERQSKSERGGLTQSTATKGLYISYTHHCYEKYDVT
ncbi:uncharacterized protein [Antedon mediterranea]|uniref:uncharacterized protein n=1 Tax=Antedon mediterranea TaxID=105859 RepID=UPI003AF499A1